jgi:UDP-glucose 4-epimerase
MGNSVLVTGGAGFIGSHLVERLLEEGREVYVVDDLSSGSLKNLQAARRHPHLHRVVDSVLNYRMMNDTVRKVDLVVHLASSEGVKMILDKPVEALTTSARGIEILLNCCHRFGKKVFVASTSEIYGTSGGELREGQDRVLGDPSRKRWVHANAKALDEALAFAYHRETGLPVVIGRFFNVVGPRQSGRWGTVLPSFVGNALTGSPIRVFGDGNQRRCFCHVEDAVDAIVRLLDSDDAVGRAFNIGSEEETTILELARLVKERSGSSSPVDLVPYDDAYGEGFEDMERRRPDLSRIQQTVGWRPTCTLQGIVDDTVEYFRSIAAN